jgi:hypothetical protein
LPIDAACTVDEDCCQNGGVQERCVLGHCQTRGQAGAACGKDFDCFGPLSCVNGTCGSRSEVGGACDSAGDCLFDQTTNTQPVCSGGTCKLPNGAACTSGGQCAIGTCVECSYGHVCGNCCARNESGIDEFFCGDAQSLKICCNNQCVRSYESTHCGTCNYDCTCGGADPLRYCGYKDYGAEFEVDRYRFYCDGHYDLASGHCDTTSGDICSSPPNCDENCDCQHISEPGGVSLFCWSQCAGQASNLEIPGFCAKDGNECLDGDDSTCCTDTSLCVEDTNCSSGAIFCLSTKYICVAGT